MESFVDLFWTGLVGFWVINQFRGFKKRQATAETMQPVGVQKEQSGFMEEIQEEIQDFIYMDNPAQSDNVNRSEPWKMDLPSVEWKEESDTVQSSRLSKRSDRYQEAEELGLTGQDEPIYQHANMEDEDHQLTADRDREDQFLPYLTGGDTKTLRRAIVLSEVLGPPVSMRKPE
jgi:hypothetical protein|tara:strand:+ start:319 stop:840 length:522 start_codon:yes stop_codon:yes gene_type:complete